MRYEIKDSCDCFGACRRLTLYFDITDEKDRKTVEALLRHGINIRSFDVRERTSKLLYLYPDIDREVWAKICEAFDKVGRLCYKGLKIKLICGRWKNERL